MSADGYAIRFLPVDSADVSPALYLSTDFDVGLTSVPVDVRPLPTMMLAWFLAEHPHAKEACARDRLRADVVPYAVALADLTAV